MTETKPLSHTEGIFEEDARKVVEFLRANPYVFIQERPSDGAAESAVLVLGKRLAERVRRLRSDTV